MNLPRIKSAITPPPWLSSRLAVATVLLGSLLTPATLPSADEALWLATLERIKRDSMSPHRVSALIDNSPTVSPVALIVKPKVPIDIIVVTLSNLIGHTVKTSRAMSGGDWVIATQSKDRDRVNHAISQLRNLNLITYGQIDATTRVGNNPVDLLFQAQWQHQTLAQTPASVGLVDTWGITTGSPDVVVAVIDTGIRYEHTDLADRLLAGYDFVSAINETPEILLPVPAAYNFAKSNDGDGRDPDPTDPGDGVDTTLHELMDRLGIDCPVSDSTWHGTAMTSLLAANANDGFGMVGVDWHARILPVRAIGRCGGNRSDLLDAIRWAAGVDDPALPPNPTPARIINLSLGIDDICGEADQRAINDAVAAGAIVVAAVGNQGRNLDQHAASPSDCDNVIGVTAVNASGQRALYSNYGLDVDIAAPGGEGAEGDDQPILVATNSGSLAPSSESTHKYTTGTSVASPLVAGVLSLMLSVNPDLNNQDLETLLYTAARAFPMTGSTQDCTALTCGAGMLDAYTAIRLAELSRSEPVPALAAAVLEDGTPTKTQSGGAAGCTLSDGTTFDPLWLLMISAMYVWSRVTQRRAHQNVA